MSVTDLKNANGKRKTFRVTVDDHMGWFHLHKLAMNYFYIKWGVKDINWFTEYKEIHYFMTHGGRVNAHEGGHYYQIMDTGEYTELYFDSAEEFKQHFIEYFI